MLKVAVLDDYAAMAPQLADWSRMRGAEFTFFERHLSEEEAVQSLAPFEVICTTRERMAFPRTLLGQLPALKLITVVGPVTNLDMQAAGELGVKVARAPMQPTRGAHPAVAGAATPELAWALALAASRSLTQEDRRMREGGWQRTLGVTLAGRTLGLLGLGRVGQRVARYGQAFGMNVIAWSANLTPETAAEHGAMRVEKDELMRESDVLSIHVILSERTRGLIGARELRLMKPTAILINTARGPIVDEAALIETLREGRIAAAGLDVFDVEPPPADHPLRRMDNVVLSPHLGYSTRDTLAAFYEASLATVEDYTAGRELRLDNAEALANRTRTAAD